jgi:hypothetical protein
MTTRAKVLFILVQGLTLHLILVIFAAVTLSPNRNMKELTATVIPFGRLNFDQITSLLAIEWLLVFILWILFAFFLFRQLHE